MTHRASHLRWTDAHGLVEVPVLEVRAPAAGPCVVITANVHGDETTGTRAALALFSELPGRLTRGRVVLYPSLNPRGLAAGVRTFGPQGPDLNRLFPGDPRGDDASRYVAAVWAHIAEQEAHALLDLHADSTASIPYAIVDRAVAHRGLERRAMDGALAALARSTGLTVLHDYPDADYVRFGLDRSVAGAAVNRLGVPALTVESGPRGVVLDGAVATAIRAVRGALAGLGLLAPEERVSPSPGGPWRRRAGPRAHRGGLFVPDLAPGETFVHGARLGRIVGLDGALREEVRAGCAGIVVAWGDDPWIHPGAGIGTLGVPEGEGSPGAPDGEEGR